MIRFVFLFIFGVFFDVWMHGDCAGIVDQKVADKLDEFKCFVCRGIDVDQNATTPCPKATEKATEKATKKATEKATEKKAKKVKPTTPQESDDEEEDDAEEEEELDEYRPAKRGKKSRRICTWQIFSSQS